MNPELQKELAQWLAALREQAGGAVNFALEQAPLVVREKVALGRAYETTWLCLLLFVWVVAFAVVVNAWKHRTARDQEDTEGPEGKGTTIACTASLVLAGLSLAVTGQSYYVYLVWLAPRIYVLEWLKGLL